MSSNLKLVFSSFFSSCWLVCGDYFTVDLLEFGLCLTHIFQFWSFSRQILGLIGKNGIQPAFQHLQNVRKFQRETAKQSWMSILSQYPTIFWLNCSDFMLQGACFLGILCSLLILFDHSTFFFLWWIIFILNLSLYKVFNPFNLQMEPMLVEISFLCSIVNGTNSPILKIWTFRWFIFRMMLSAGLVKWYGSKKWRNLTAMTVHYFTQPLPNTLSWYAHHLPLWFHKISVAMTLLIEGPLCFLIFGPSFLRYLVCFGNSLLMIGINVTGNYGHLGFTTLVLSISLLDDSFFQFFFHFNQSFVPETTLIGEIYLWVATTIILVYISITLIPLIDCAKGHFPLKLPSFIYILYDWVRPLMIVNQYGMFGAMHDFRWELQIEGSQDGVTWKPYLFKYKINDAHTPPPIILFFYWPRLDWMIWFLPLHFRYQDQIDARPPFWFRQVMRALINGNQQVISLFKHNPFPQKPPNYVRTQVYDFKFSPLGSKDYWIVKGPICQYGTTVTRDERVK